MQSRIFSKAIRDSASASVVACTASMVATQAEATPIWIDAPHVEGHFQAQSSDPNSAEANWGHYADFDQDGSREFLIYFSFYNTYFGLQLIRSMNPTADILIDSYRVVVDNPWIVPTVFESRDDVYTSAMAYTPIPRPIDFVRNDDSIDSYFESRSFLGVVFEAGDSNTYVGYLDLEVNTAGGNAEEAFMTIYDAGYALLPEPVIPGDTDNDGDIDDSDLGTSFANYTGPVGAIGGKAAATGDTDGDGDVDDSDLGTSFAGYTGPVASVSVPEPTSTALMGIGGLLLARRRHS